MSIFEGHEESSASASASDTISNQEGENLMSFNNKEEPTGYEDLEEILHEAFLQASEGKGRERHADNLPFLQQDIIQITSLTGILGPAYQVIKKIKEAGRMLKRGERDKAVIEILGAIVYAAAIGIAIKKEKI
jgi:hypothetical protein